MRRVREKGVLELGEAFELTVRAGLFVEGMLGAALGLFGKGARELGLMRGLVLENLDPIGEGKRKKNEFERGPCGQHEE